MTAELYALLTRVHGHLAMLGLAVLLHPVITLARRKGLSVWTLRTAWIAAAMIAAPFALGWFLYPHYRMHVKVDLWQRGDAALLRFETKEHLAAFAVALAVSGAGVLQAAGRTPEGRRAAWALLLAAWCCGMATGLLGVWVGARAHPGW